MLFEVGIPLLFAIPFLIFSMPGGFLADRFSKRSVTIATKFMEITVMCLALAGLAMNYLPMEIAAVFLVATQAAIFGPSKYGLLPEVLPEKKLSWGNGILELGTFIAVLTGTIFAAVLSSHFHGRQQWSGFILIGLSVVGLVTSLGITKVPPADPTKKFRANLVGDLWTQMKLIGQDRVLKLAVIGNIYFWFLGSLLLINIVLYSKDILHASDTKTSLLMAAVTIGIGVGSFAAGYLSGNKIEYGLIPLGSIGITVMAALLGRPHLSYDSVAAHLAMLGFFAGFFAVPILALIQHRPAPEHKGGVIAAANLLSFVGIALQPVAQLIMMKVGHPNPVMIFMITAGLTALATVYVVVLLPDSLLRLVLWMLTHSLYRIRVEGRDNIPERGGALFVANHMSLVDGLLLIASTDRPIRFILFKDIYDMPIVKPFAKLLRSIPISSQLRPRDMLKSLRDASEAIQAGEVVCIFAEGQITRIGQLLPFRRGFERIMRGVDAPIVPVNLDGVWGSIFSYEKGRFLWKLPRRIPYPVTVSFGKPMPPNSTPFEVRQAVQELATAAYRNHKPRLQAGAPVVCGLGAPASVSICDGRRAAAAREIRGGAAGDFVSGAAAAKNVGRARHGGDHAAAFGTGSDGEFRGDADRKDSGEFKLYGVERDAGLVREAVRIDDGGDIEGAAREIESGSADGNDFAGRRGGESAVNGKNNCAVHVVPAGSLDRADLRRQAPGDIGRPGDNYFFERKHGRSQGRDADALQHRVEHRAVGSNIHAGAAGLHAGSVAIFSFVWIYGDAVFACGAGGGSCVPSESAGPGCGWGTGTRIPGDVSAFHSDFLAGVFEALLAGGFWQRAIRDGGSGEIAGTVITCV